MGERSRNEIYRQKSVTNKKSRTYDISDICQISKNSTTSSQASSSFGLHSLMRRNAVQMRRTLGKRNPCRRSENIGQIRKIVPPREGPPTYWGCPPTVRRNSQPEMENVYRSKCGGPWGWGYSGGGCILPILIFIFCFWLAQRGHMTLSEWGSSSFWATFSTSGWLLRLTGGGHPL